MQHPENKDQKGKSENYICAKLHSTPLRPSEISEKNVIFDIPFMIGNYPEIKVHIL